MKTKILLLALSVLFLASCSQKWCSARYPQIASQDSLYIETIKEMPIYLPGDSILVDVLINCPDQDLVNIETRKLKQQIRILNGRLISSTNIKPDTVYIYSKETIIKTNVVKVPEKVRFVPKFFKFCTWGFVFIVLSIIVYFVIKYRFKLLSLIKK